MESAEFDQNHNREYTLLFVYYDFSFIVENGKPALLTKRGTKTFIFNFENDDEAIERGNTLYNWLGKMCFVEREIQLRKCIDYFNMTVEKISKENRLNTFTKYRELFNPEIEYYIFQNYETVIHKSNGCSSFMKPWILCIMETYCKDQFHSGYPLNDNDLKEDGVYDTSRYNFPKVLDL